MYILQKLKALFLFAVYAARKNSRHLTRKKKSGSKEGLLNLNQYFIDMVC